MPARPAALALLACAALAVAVAWAGVRRARRRSAVPRALEVFLAELATPLGEAAIALDAAGRVVWANEAAARLAGRARGALLGRGRDALGEDLAMLLQGLAHGPAAGRVALPAGVAAQAAAARLAGPPALDVALLRAVPADASLVEDADIVGEAAPAPPPLRVGPALTSPKLKPSLAAVAVELAAPVSRARAAAALLRLALPRTPGDAHLASLERELEAVEAALSALAAPLPPAVPRPVDLAGLLSEALGRASFAAGVRLRRVGGAAAALADAGQLREAIGHLLALASAAMPSGGELGLRTGQRGAEALLEISDTGAEAPAGLGLALAERLVAAQGGRLERASVAGRGGLWRVALPAAGQAPRAASGFDRAGTPR